MILSFTLHLNNSEGMLFIGISLHYDDCVKQRFLCIAPRGAKAAGEKPFSDILTDNCDDDVVARMFDRVMFNARVNLFGRCVKSRLRKIKS